MTIRKIICKEKKLLIKLFVRIFHINLQPLLDIVIYVQKLTGAIGIQVLHNIVNNY